MALLTHDRINALGHINRWRGWTTRPFSVLEHTVLGGKFLMMENQPIKIIRAWLLHDLEETEFCGDVPTPDKVLYCNADYHQAVQGFNQKIEFETGVNVDQPEVHLMDKTMVKIERATVVMGRNLEYFGMEWTPNELAMRSVMLNGLYGDTKKAAGEFWNLWYA